MKKHIHSMQIVLPKVIAAGLAVVSSIHISAQDKPLNIIYIMSDDHASQTISCYDTRFTQTPNIDRIANEGVRFTQSFVANSLSGPSRACMLTGKHSHVNGFATNNDRFDGSQQTMPKLMQKAGYQTAMIGKWHLTSQPTGFDYWDILPDQGQYYQPDFISVNGKYKVKGYATDLITDKSINWLEHRKKDQPFLLFVHHKAPHRNWLPRVQDLSAYEDRTFPVPANFYDTYENRLAASSSEMSIERDMHFMYDLKVPNPYAKIREQMFAENDTTSHFGRMSADEKLVFAHFYDSISNDLIKRNLKGKELAEWKYQRYVRDYLKTTKAVDENIGRLMQYLEENNLLENTLIVYTSDQGFYMGEHGWFDKRFMYEESMSTPLVMRLPKGFNRRGDVVEMVQNIDHAPTFLEIAGAPVPADIQGESYLPLLKNKPKNTDRKALYYHYQEYPAEHAVKRHYGIRTDRYKLIHFYHDINSWELYDLKNDPSEMQNLIDSPEHQNLIVQLKNDLLDLQVKYNDSIRFKQPDSNYVKMPLRANKEQILHTAANVRPSQRQLEWQKMEYYAFIHFGMNTFTGREWGDGKDSPELFNPTALDAEQWVRSIRDAGMKGVILTAKHHDGFCLWPTQTTDYSVKSSPWRNGRGDLVKEVSAACKKYGIKLGLYLSPWDRNHPAYGDTPAYNKVFMSQLTELLTNYGELFELWFDGANGEGPNGKVQEYDFESYYALIRKLQPNAVIAIMGPDVRWCGNEAGKGRDPEWSVLPIEAASRRLIAENSQQKAGAFVPRDLTKADLGSYDKIQNSSALIWYPSEVDTSIRPGWFYHAEQDGQVKTPSMLENIYYNSIGLNASLLLNLPPDRRGLIHENDLKNLMEFRMIIDQTFKSNLLKSDKKLKDITDGDIETGMMINTKDTSIIFNFKKEITFDRFLIQEKISSGQKVEHFSLEYLADGKWIQFAEGNTIGYKRILRFSEQKAKTIRLKITASRAVPIIAEAGFYQSKTTQK